RSVVVKGRFLATPRLAAEGNAQHLRYQRAAGIDAELMGLAAATVFARATVDLRRTLPGIGSPPRDDIDHASKRLGAVKGRHRAANHFDTFDRLYRHPAQ